MNIYRISHKIKTIAATIATMMPIHISRRPSGISSSDVSQLQSLSFGANEPFHLMNKLWLKYQSPFSILNLSLHIVEALVPRAVWSIEDSIGLNCFSIDLLWWLNFFRIDSSCISNIPLIKEKTMKNQWIHWIVPTLVWKRTIIIPNRTSIISVCLYVWIQIEETIVKLYWATAYKLSKSIFSFVNSSSPSYFFHVAAQSATTNSAHSIESVLCNE